MYLSEQGKNVMDTVSVATVFAALATWLPPAAALASLLWTGIRIWETKTVQSWIRTQKARNACTQCGHVHDSIRGDL